MLRSMELILAFQLGLRCIRLPNSIGQYNISIIGLYLIYHPAQDIASRIIFSISECCVFGRTYCEF